jgi:effector-binding domain-containing protein
MGEENMIEVEVVDRVPQLAAVRHAELPMEELSGFFDSVFGDVAAAVATAGGTITGPPIGHFPTPPGEVFVVNAGFPVSSPVDSPDDVHTIELPGGPAAVVIHVGSYDTLPDTYAALTAWLAAEGRTPSGPMWESYLSDPSAEPDPSTWRTEIVCPLST